MGRGRLQGFSHVPQLALVALLSAAATPVRAWHGFVQVCCPHVSGPLQVASQRHRAGAEQGISFVACPPTQRRSVGKLQGGQGVASNTTTPASAPATPPAGGSDGNSASDFLFDAAPPAAPDPAAAAEAAAEKVPVAEWQGSAHA